MGRIVARLHNYTKRSSLSAVNPMQLYVHARILENVSWNILCDLLILIMDLMLAYITIVFHETSVFNRFNPVPYSPLPFRVQSREIRMKEQHILISSRILPHTCCIPKMTVYLIFCGKQELHVIYPRSATVLITARLKIQPRVSKRLPRKINQSQC